MAVITLDLVGIGHDLTDPICAALESKYQLPRANVAICCSHTHSGPVVGHSLPSLHYYLLDAEQQRLIDRYAAELIPKVVGVVGSAMEKLAPSELAWGHGIVRFAANRRNNKEPDVPALRTSGSCQGPFDHDVPVLKIADKDGKLTAVLFGYACHATVLDGYDWSSDYPGFAQDELESRHPGVTALFFAGCGGDQNPLPRRQVPLARQYGKDLAAAVDEALAGKLEPVAGNIANGLARSAARSGSRAVERRSRARRGIRVIATSPRGPRCICRCLPRAVRYRRAMPTRFKFGGWALS